MGPRMLSSHKAQPPGYFGHGKLRLSHISNKIKKTKNREEKNENWVRSRFCNTYDEMQPTLPRSSFLTTKLSRPHQNLQVVIRHWIATPSGGTKEKYTNKELSFLPKWRTLKDLPQGIRVKYQMLATMHKRKTSLLPEWMSMNFASDASLDACHKVLK